MAAKFGTCVDLRSDFIASHKHWNLFEQNRPVINIEAVEWRGLWVADI